MPPPIPENHRRSLVVTLLAWVMMLAGGLGLPISFITAAMLLVGSYGTANAGLVDSCCFVLGPVALLVAGFGLLKRWRWAWHFTMGIVGVVLFFQAARLSEEPRPTTTTVSPSGVKTTTIGSRPNDTSLPIMIICMGVLVILITPAVRSEFPRSPSIPKPSVASPVPTRSVAANGANDDRRGWRVGHRGRDMMFYEEKMKGTWQRIDIDGEMLLGRAHHVIYFPSAERWQSYPAWARHRRDEIMARIKSEFREPDYEYEDGGTTGSAITGSAGTPFSPDRAEKVTAKNWLAMIAIIGLFGGLAFGMGWLVISGIQKDHTYLPTKRASLRRVIHREQEPVTFYVALGVYTLVGTAAAGCSLWMMRESWKLARK
jgi:hypothetical protein